MMRFITAVLAVIVVFGTSGAAERGVFGARAGGLDDTSRQAPTTGLLIRNATLIDGTGRPATGGSSILITAATITAVGQISEVPSGVKVIDATGKFVVPGLIDCHVHLHYTMASQLSATEATAIRAHNPAAFMYNGVTTVLDLGARSSEEIWGMRRDQRAGILTAPRIYATGRSFTPTGGTGAADGEVVAGPEDARRKVREYGVNGADGIKVMIEKGHGSADIYRVFDDATLRAITDEAGKAQLPVFVHAIDLQAYRRAAAIRPRAIVHGLEHPLEANDPLLSELAKDGTFVVPTISLIESFERLDHHPELFDDPVLRGSVPHFLLDRMRMPAFMEIEKDYFRTKSHTDTYAWGRAILPHFKANTKKMHDAGVRIAVGTDGGGSVGYDFQGYNTPRELELLVEIGFTPMEAIVAGTRTGAEVIGVQSQLGTLERGKLADLLVLKADPLTNIANIREIETVVQGGRVYAREAFAYTPPAAIVR